MKGLIFDIQGFSVHDGSGCRTLVFLSGCPLRCSWCSNPEGQLLQPRLMFRERKCVHTHFRCIEACPHNGIQVNKDNGPPLRFEHSTCDHCETMDCVKACLSNALQVAGRYYTVDELMRILTRDQDYWGSDGGVTFSGGEPLVQTEFLLEVLKKCRSSYIHTAVETSAYSDINTLMKILDWTDWIFIDIKHMDTAAHKIETGLGNELILENIERVASSNWKGRMIIRVPIVPGYNDSEKNLQATASFMANLNLSEVNLLAFHRLGHSKYDQLGMSYRFAELEPPLREDMVSHQRIFQDAGLHCYVDTETPF